MHPAPAPSSPIRVLVVDDNKLIRDAVRLMLEHAAGIECVGFLESADDLIEKAEELGPDVIVLDLDMPGADAMAVMRELAVRRPQTRTVIYTGHLSPGLIERVFDAGAWGFVDKSEEASAIVEAVRRVSAGEVVVAPLRSPRAR